MLCGAPKLGTQLGGNPTGATSWTPQLWGVGASHVPGKEAEVDTHCPLRPKLTHDMGSDPTWSHLPASEAGQAEASQSR